MGFIAYSQEKAIDRLSFSVRERYGFIIPHHSSFVYLIEDHVKSWDFTLNFSSKGDKNWQQIYRYPELGMGFYHANLGNTDYLGKANAGYGIIKIPIFQTKVSKFNYMIGGGVVFLSKHFDAKDNIYNVAIGSAANAFVDFGLNFELKCWSKLFITTGLQFTHFSNGAWKIPNLGFNIPSANLGLKYFLKEPSLLPKVKVSNADFKKAMEFGIIYRGGIRENSPPLGQKYYVSSLSISSEKHLTQKRMLGLGLDLYWDPSISQRLKTDSTEALKTNNFRSGVHFAHNVVFNKVYFVMQLGYYFYTNDIRGDKRIYSRFGLQIKLSEHFSTSLTLKSHKFKADVIEFGMGYLIKK